MWDTAATLHDQVALGSIPDYRYDIGLQAKSDTQWFFCPSFYSPNPRLICATWGFV